MQDLIVSAINTHLKSLTNQKIGVIAISGNTVMQHILIGEEISSFGYAPYTPKFLEEKF